MPSTDLLRLPSVRAAVERERAECARLAEELAARWAASEDSSHTHRAAVLGAQFVAAAIRLRGQGGR